LTTHDDQTNARGHELVLTQPPMLREHHFRNPS
jgi:hypothetical protein